MLIKSNKITKNRLILIMLLILAFLAGCLYDRRFAYRDRATAASDIQADKEQCNCERLLVNTYLKRIERASDNFYEEYYTVSPTVAYYYVTVKEFISDESHSQVTFTSTPFLGPHDTIGMDEITFSADYTGKVNLEKFNHMISYHLPKNLKDLEKKRVPGIYGDD